MSKNSKIRVILIIVLTFVVIVFTLISIKLFENKTQYAYRESPVATNSYINIEKYVSKKYAFRNVEYIGGTRVDINRPFMISNREDKFVGKRWMPFYVDKNTNEILRGKESEDYITAGECFVGLDHLNVPKERMTKEGFKQYVLDWTGSVLYSHKINYKDNYLKQYNTISKKYASGVYECNRTIYPYDLSIDLLAESMWCTEKKRNKEEIISIDSIDAINNIGALDDGAYENYGYLSENEWILNILRNCFGFISDDFYSLLDDNQINFTEIDIRDVKIGDIGIFNNEGDCNSGLCIGFDESKNPIFTICSSKQLLNKLIEMSDYHSELFESLGAFYSIYGFNILHVEDIKGNNRIFSKYYSTNLPFADNELGNANNKKLVIKNIKKYNDQILYKKNIKEGIWKGVDLNDRLLSERLRRIKSREQNAFLIRKKYNIDLEQYNDKDISNLYFIHENNSYEYSLFWYDLVGKPTRKMGQNIKSIDKQSGVEGFKRRTDNEKIEEKRNNAIEQYNDLTENEINNMYNRAIFQIESIIKKNKELYRDCDNDTLLNLILNQGGTRIDYILIKRYIDENPNILE